MQIKRIKVLIVVAVIVKCQLLIVDSSFAQVNYTSEYKNAKQLFEEGKYNLSMEVFKRTIPYDNVNPYSEYASFYFAVAAFKQKYFSVSKDMLLQIKTLYPKWEKIDDVNYWLSLNYFETGDFFQAIKQIRDLKDSKFAEDAEKAKHHFIATINDRETLMMLREEYPKDETVGKALATHLAQNLKTTADRKELESLLNSYKLDRDDFITPPAKSFFKDVYSVAVVFPFMVSTLDATTSKKKNQFVIDLYQGIALANGELEKEGVKISLRVYDTERQTDKLKSILETQELKNADLVLGPVLREENPLIQEFSRANQVNVINPLANDSDLVKSNLFGFLFQPSIEMLGQKSAVYLSNDLANRKKKCLVFYGANVRDSVLAWNFIRKAEEVGIKVILKQEVFREESSKIEAILATPTEYDEWKAPIQFTIPKDSIGAIFVASDDPVIYTKVVSAVEMRKDKTLILGGEHWLENGSIDLAKFQQMNFVLYAPNFVSVNNTAYQAFNKLFAEKHGKSPNNYVRTGFELMMVLGRSLHKYGVYIQDGFNKEEQAGHLNVGHDFRFTNYNQVVPFVKFKDGSLELIAKH